MAESIYTLLDHSDGKIPSTSWEVLALGQQLAQDRGCSLHPLILGRDAAALAQQVLGKKADSVLAVQHEQLGDYSPDIYSETLRQILVEDRPDLFLMAHTYQNIDLAPRLAASLKSGLVTDCIGYKQRGDDLLFSRQMFRNKINADVRIRSAPPWLVTLQSGAVSSDDILPGSSSVVERTVDLSQIVVKRKSLEVVASAKERVDLGKAEIIVAVGRGIKESANLKIIQELAEVLGAEIGASRAAVDSEWLERSRQIGSSGQTVSPRLYLACGISGAIQHVVGMRNSGCIVAINSDPNAPIFNIATYGIVADLREIVPALTRKIKEVKGL
jgi:electron transfer flavoprotein alpha subunit